MATARDARLRGTPSRTSKRCASNCRSTGKYREGCPEGYSYSHFCALDARWRQSRDPVLRQDHKVGEKLFIDYAGPTVTVHAPEGEFEAPLFVAVLGASSYTYVEASRAQDLRSWLASHVRALHFFRGAPALLVPDNLKSAVTRACRYEPVEHRSYAELAEHYGMSVVPEATRHFAARSQDALDLLLHPPD